MKFQKLVKAEESIDNSSTILNKQITAIRSKLDNLQKDNFDTLRAHQVQKIYKVLTNVWNELDKLESY